MALESAADGLGLAIGRLPIIDDDIAAGRLAIAVDHVVPVMSGYWLVKPPGLETRREIESVGIVDALIGELRRNTVPPALVARADKVIE